MKFSINFFIAAFLAICGPLSAANINLVANGSFEQGSFGIGSFQSWQTTLGDTSTFVDSSGQTGPHYGQASDGLWAAYFGSTAAAGGASILETLATTVNQRYVITFSLAIDNGGSASLNSFAVSVAGATPLSLTNAANQDFRLYQFSFVASSAATQLKFSGSNENGYLELDNVAVVATPEPGTLGLLMGGTLATGLAFRVFRRRKGSVLYNANCRLSSNAARNAYRT